MKLVIALGLMLLSTPAFAKDITLTLNDEEQKAFLILLDTALRQGGLSRLQSVTQFLQKYQAAAGPVAQAPQEPPKE